MAIKAKAPEGGNFERELIPAGMHVARCYSMVHIGTVEWEWKGQKKTSNKVRLTWELPLEMRVFKEENGEQPMVISKEFTLSWFEKSNLRQTIENWMGKKFSDKEADGFDITKLLGVPCMLNIAHVVSPNNGKTYCNILNITPVPKGMLCPPQVNPSFEWNYDDKFDIDWVNNQPDFIKDAIKSTPEWELRIDQLEGGEVWDKLNQVANEGFEKVNEGLPF